MSMRKLRVMAFVAPSLLLLVGACEDSGSSSGSPFTVPEGGVFETGPGFDAGLLDGASADSAADAAIDAPIVPKGVAVAVIDGDTSLPKSNVRVVFHDATGAVVGQTTTNALGRATAAAAPSMVTVLTTSFGTQAGNITFTSVAEGDNLVVALRNNINEPAPVGFFSVTFGDPNGIAATANSIGVVGGNGSGVPSCTGFSRAVAQSAGVSLYPNCLAAQNAVLATAALDGNVLGLAFTKTAAKPAMGATVNVGPLAFAAPGKTTLKATNLPWPRTVLKRSGLLAIASNQAVDMSSFASGTIEDAVKGVEYRTATGFADAYQALVGTDTFGSVQQSRDIVQRVATTAPAAFAFPSVDFSTALPLIDNVVVAAPVVRPAITVTSATAFTGKGAGVVSFGWSNPAGNTGGTWTFVVPGNITAVKAPALPSDATAFTPAGSTFPDSAIYFDATQITSYAAAKLLPVSPRVGSDVSNTSRALPSAGTLRVTRWYPGGT